MVIPELSKDELMIIKYIKVTAFIFAIAIIGISIPYVLDKFELKINTDYMRHNEILYQSIGKGNYNTIQNISNVIYVRAILGKIKIKTCDMKSCENSYHTDDLIVITNKEYISIASYSIMCKSDYIISDNLKLLNKAYNKIKILKSNDIYKLSTPLLWNAKFMTPGYMVGMGFTKDKNCEKVDYIDRSFRRWHYNGPTRYICIKNRNIYCNSSYYVHISNAIIETLFTVIYVVIFVILFIFGISIAMFFMFKILDRYYK
jgi:hypothetical protein